MTEQRPAAEAPPLEELDLRSYFRPIWRRKWIVLAIVIVAAAATYLIASREHKTYTASTELYVQVADPTLDITQGGSSSPPSSQSIADVAQLITAQSVTNSVSQTIGMPAASAGSVTATPSTTSDFVTVTATSHSPVLAARLANAYVSDFLAARRQAVTAEALRDGQAALATLKSLPNNASNSDQRRTLLDQIETYKQVAVNPSAGARPIDAAVVPAAPTSPRPVRDAIFGGAIGLVLALVVAFGLELLDRRLVRVSTVESTLDRPVLAVLPHVDDPAPLSAGEVPTVPPPFLEELRSLRVMLRLSGEREAPRTLMITSALPGEGKSSVVRDLALVYAESGDRVLVIDSDLRRPSMQRLFGLEAARGLVHVLRGELELSDAVLSAMPVISKGSSNGHGPSNRDGGTRKIPGSVEVLTHGEQLENPIALLSSEAMWSLLDQAREAYDVVLIDTAPVLTVADNVSQLEVVDSVLLVTRLGQVTRESAQRFNELIDRLSGVNVTGVIVNDRREKRDDEGYGSYGRYGYGYYATKPGGSRQKASTSAP